MLYLSKFFPTLEAKESKRTGVYSPHAVAVVNKLAVTFILAY